jgi:hypothetical protein
MAGDVFAVPIYDECESSRRLWSSSECTGASNCLSTGTSFVVREGSGNVGKGGVNDSTVTRGPMFVMVVTSDHIGVSEYGFPLI